MLYSGVFMLLAGAAQSTEPAGRAALSHAHLLVCLEAMATACRSPASLGGTPPASTGGPRRTRGVCTSNPRAPAAAVLLRNTCA